MPVHDAGTADRELRETVEQRSRREVIGRAVGGATLVLMAGNLSASALGFVRQAVIDGVFGANARTDAFFAASFVPQMFYDLTIGAAISAALIPSFTETVERDGSPALWDLLGAVLALVWLLLAVVVLLLLLVARPFMSLLAQGLQPETSGHAVPLAVELARVLIFTLLFLGTSAVLLSALYSLRRFTAPAFAPCLYHLGVIGSAAMLARPLGIVALPIGALVGSAAQAGVQAVALFRRRPRIRLRLDLTPEVRRIARLYAPVAVGLVISVLGQIVDIHFKWSLHRGGFSAMQNATMLTQFPIGIAVAALSFAVLPTLSTEAAFERIDAFKETLGLGIRFVLFLTIPAAVGYVVLATPIVALLFQHGQFQQADTRATSLALAGYAVQIPFVGVDQLLIFAFYARKNTVTPMMVGVLGVGIYIVSALLLMPRLHILGLALANTVQNSLHALILVVLLVLSIGRLRDAGMWRSIGTSLVAAGAMGGCLLACLAVLPAGGTLTNILDVLASVGVGALAYLTVQGLLGSHELRMVLTLGRRPRMSSR